jgi:nitroreductase
VAGLRHVLAEHHGGGARAGLDTCPQAAFIQYHRIIRGTGVPASEMVVCGMALGYADPDKVENRLARNASRWPALLNSLPLSYL